MAQKGPGSAPGGLSGQGRVRASTTIGGEGKAREVTKGHPEGGAEKGDNPGGGSWGGKKR